MARSVTIIATARNLSKIAARDTIAFPSAHLALTILAEQRTSSHVLCQWMNFFSRRPVRGASRHRRDASSRATHQAVGLIARIRDAFVGRFGGEDVIEFRRERAVGTAHAADAIASGIDM